MITKPWRVAAVEYLNTVLFVEGLRDSGQLEENFELILDNPAGCSKRMLDGSADMGLVPVGSLPLIRPKFVLGDYCIGADGPVRTVRLFSQCDISRIESVMLDSHSRTSVKLIEVLFREHWKRSVQFIPAKAGFETEPVSETTAILAIGDKVFNIEKKYTYSFDLAEEWIRLTGTEFVFAVWASNVLLDDDRLEGFKNALSLGLSNREKTIHKFRLAGKYEDVELEEYLTRNISYPFNESKRTGMALFLKLAGFEDLSLSYL